MVAFTPIHFSDLHVNKWGRLSLTVWCVNKKIDLQVSTNKMIDRQVNKWGIFSINVQ